MSGNLLDERARVFLCVYRAGSFTQAAKTLLVSSVWVMKQMNSFETSLGIRLFIRTNHGVIPTDAGQMLFDDLSRMEREGEDVLARVRMIANEKEGVVRIGTSILRPCQPLIDLISHAASASFPFRIQVVPFEDDPSVFNRMVETLGEEIDCFVSPCDSSTWREQCSIHELGQLRCAVAMPRDHELATKTELNIEDLDNQELMLIKRGESPVLDRLRNYLEGNHPKVSIIDVANFYGLNAFNECERRGCLMETFELWNSVHPMLVTIPVKWEYELPYGIVYAKKPEERVSEFIDAVASLVS